MKTNIPYNPCSRFKDTFGKQYLELLSDVFQDDDQFETTKICLDTEKELSNMIGRKHSLLTTSGTVALLEMLIAAGVKAGDEVLTINYSCPASVMPIKLLGANPVFIDIDQFGQMDLNQCKDKITSRTTAILVTGLYGDNADFDVLKDINLPILNDSAQSILSQYKGKESVQHGVMSIASFSINKNLPVWGTYGAVFTDDDELASKLKHIRKNGHSNRDAKTNIPYIGINGQPTPDKCAQVFCTLQHKDWYQRRRAEINKYYDQELASSEIDTRPSPEYSQTSYHKYCIFVNNKQEFRDILLTKGIECQLHYTFNFSKTLSLGGVNSNSAYPWTEFYASHAMSLPNSPWHTDAEIEYIVKSIKETMSSLDTNLFKFNTQNLI